MVRPSREELLARPAPRHIEFARSEMKDFCFTIDYHHDDDRVWFGICTVTVNRNVAFHFYDREIPDDPNIEPFPVARAERTETLTLQVNPYPEDPGSAHALTVFHLGRAEFVAAMDSIMRIATEYEGIRVIPDVYFEGEALVKLLRERLLVHPAVQKEREADWPSLL